MNSLTSTKVIGYLAIIFVAGAATGAVIVFNNSRAQAIQAPPSMEKTCSRLQDRLVNKVGLTPAQVTKLQPVFDQAARELRTIHTKAIRDTDAVICKVHHQIAAELSPEQKVKLDALDIKRKEWLRLRLKDRDQEGQKEGKER